jgi:CII-binding regulator of phage lambda lysogenization HflD
VFFSVDYIHLTMDTPLMAVPAKRINVEHPMDVEARLTGLEQQTKHLQSDVAEIKSNLIRMDTKLDAVKDSVSSLGQKVVAIEPKLNSMEVLFDAKLSALNAMQAAMTRWVVGTMIAMTGAVLGIVKFVG